MKSGKPLSYYVNRLLVGAGILTFGYTCILTAGALLANEFTISGELIKFYVLGNTLCLSFLCIAVLGFNKSLDTFILLYKGKSNKENIDEN